MAYYAPNGPPPRTNPDTRLLPDGWITQFDPNYNTWFYVSTREMPPRSVWVHPIDAAHPQYAPPLGPPPGFPSANRDGGTPSDYYHGTPSPYAPPPPQHSPYDPSYSHGSEGYGHGYSESDSHKEKSHGGEKGGLFGKLFGGKKHDSHGHDSYHGSDSHGYGGGGGHGYESGGYGHGQQVVYVEEKKKKDSHTGRNMALAGGAGLVGGLVVADAIDDIGDAEEEREAYQQGYEDAQEEEEEDSD